MSAICDRIDAALEKVAFRNMEVRAIYLTEADYEALKKHETRHWRKKLGSKATFWPTSYRDHHLRSGNRSIIYSTHGVGVAIPKKLSAKVAA